MFARFFRRRRQRRYVRQPELNYSHGSIVVTLMTFGH